MPRKPATASRETTLLPADRHRRIVTMVNRQGSVRAVDLSKLFSVTQETIRLDLEKLETEGLLLRRHGGAVTLHSPHAETPFNERRVALAEEKCAIARAALQDIVEGDTILLDASSTAWQLSRLLPDMPLTVLTPAIKVVMELANRRNIHIISIGGTLLAPSLSFVGPLAERSVREYHVDKLFLSCAGVDFTYGLTDAHEWQATLKRRMIEHSDRRILLVDHSKLGTRALATFGKLTDVDSVITDNRCDPDLLKRLQSAGPAVTIARVDAQ